MNTRYSSGEPYSDGDTSTWILSAAAVSRGDERPWKVTGPDGSYRGRRTQAEADAADLVLLHALTPAESRVLAAAQAVSTGIPDPSARIAATDHQPIRISPIGERIALNPKDPEDVKAALDCLHAADPDTVQLAFLGREQEARARVFSAIADDNETAAQGEPEESGSGTPKSSAVDAATLHAVTSALGAFEVLFPDHGIIRNARTFLENEADRADAARTKPEPKTPERKPEEAIAGILRGVVTSPLTGVFIDAMRAGSKRDVGPRK